VSDVALAARDRARDRHADPRDRRGGRVRVALIPASPNGRAPGC
jgi:hypothetical protein